MAKLEHKRDAIVRSVVLQLHTSIEDLMISARLAHTLIAALAGSIVVMLLNLFLIVQILGVPLPGFGPHSYCQDRACAIECIGNRNRLRPVKAR